MASQFQSYSQQVAAQQQQQAQQASQQQQQQQQQMLQANQTSQQQHYYNSQVPQQQLQEQFQLQHQARLAGSVGSAPSSGVNGANAVSRGGPQVSSGWHMGTSGAGGSLGGSVAAAAAGPVGIGLIGNQQSRSQKTVQPVSSQQTTKGLDAAKQATGSSTVGGGGGVHQMGGSNTGPRHGSGGGQQQPSHQHSTSQPGSHHGNGSRFGTGFPGAISSAAAFGATVQSDDQSFKDQQERERQKALEQAKNFLNPQNKPPAKMMSKVAKDSVDASRNSAKATEPQTTTKDKGKEQ